MRVCNIEVSDITFLNVVNCTITKKINTHGIAKIEGFIEEENQMSYLNLCAGENYFTVYAIGEKQERQILFKGIPKEAKVISEGGLKKLILTLITGSIHMDLTERTRTFQNVGMTYKEVVRSTESLNQDVNAKSIFLEDADSTIGDLIVQFKETDWEFVKRMPPILTMEASCFRFLLCILHQMVRDGIVCLRKGIR